MTHINTSLLTVMTAQVVIPSVRGSSSSSYKMTIPFLMASLHTPATFDAFVP